MSRYSDFNYEALCRRVIALVPGATTVTRTKKREGMYNRAFVMYTDTKKIVLAKLPLSCAGPASLLTHSEVATIEYRMFDSTQPKYCRI